jgi:hypothetical protein
MTLLIEDYALIGDCKRQHWSAVTAPSTGCAGLVSIRPHALLHCSGLLNTAAD